MVSTVAEPYPQDKNPSLYQVLVIYIQCLVVLNLSLFPWGGSKKHKKKYLRL